MSEAAIADATAGAALSAHMRARRSTTGSPSFPQAAALGGALGAARRAAREHGYLTQAI